MEAAPKVSFGEAIKRFFSNYVNFTDRARRSEFWWVVLFNLLINMAIGAFAPAMSGLFSLAIFLPSIAVGVRRLHDVGKSGWWYLLVLVPFGALVLLVWFCMDSKGDNVWGPNPKVVSAWQPVTPDPPEVFAPVQPVTPVRSIEPVKAVVAPVAEATVPQAEAKGVTLYLYSGPMAGTCFKIPAGSAKVLGRNPAKSDLLLKQYETVSGAHCRIACCGDYITVTDLNSTNGTYVNGVRLTPNQAVSAQNGANIYLANSACAFQVRF